MFTQLYQRKTSARAATRALATNGARAVGRTIVPNHARAVGRTIVPNHARTVAGGIIHNHSRAVARALNPNHARAVGRSLGYNHARAVGRAIVLNHSRAVVPRGAAEPRCDEMAVLMPGGCVPAGPAAPAVHGAAILPGALAGDAAVTASHPAAGVALGLRDQALAALDGGDPAAVLVAVAEIEEGLAGCRRGARVRRRAACTRRVQDMKEQGERQ